MALRVQHDILGLQVAVHKVQGVQVLQRHQDLRGIEAGLRLLQVRLDNVDAGGGRQGGLGRGLCGQRGGRVACVVLGLDEVQEVAAGQVVHDNVERRLVLEGGHDGADVGARLRRDKGHDVALLPELRGGLLALQRRLVHGLHGIEASIPLVLHQQDLGL